MKRSACLVPLAAVLAATALAPTAQAAPRRGTVLQVDRSAHVVRTVGAGGAVGSYRVRGPLGRLRPGARVRFTSSGHRARNVRVTGRARTARFPARVAEAGGDGAQLTLPDGRPFTVGGGPGADGAPAGRAVSVTVSGLQLGQRVLVTVHFADNGDISIDVAVQQDAAPEDPADDDHAGDDGEDPGDDGADCAACPTARNAVSGNVRGVNRSAGTFSIGQPFDDDLTFRATAAQLAALSVGDTALVRYDPSAQGRVRDALEVHVVAGAKPEDGYGVLDGTVSWTNLDAGLLAVWKPTDGARVVLSGPCWLVVSLWKTEDVSVVYHSDPSGDLVADTVAPRDGSRD